MSKNEKKITFKELVEAWNSVVDIREPDLCHAKDSVVFKYLCQNLNLESELLELKSKKVKNIKPLK